MKTIFGIKNSYWFIGSLLAGLITGLIILNITRTDNYPTIYDLGEKISLEGFEITLLSNKDVQFEEPNSGMNLHYQVLELSITNKSNVELSFIPVFQAYIRNSSGENIDMAPLPGINPIYAGNISPGMTISGELSFYIKTEDNNQIFMFDPGWNNVSPVYIRL
jgi:hypothetical protein